MFCTKTGGNILPTWGMFPFRVELRNRCRRGFMVCICTQWWRRYEAIDHRIGRGVIEIDLDTSERMGKDAN